MAAVVVGDAWPSNKVVPTDTDGLPIKLDLSQLIQFLSSPLSLPYFCQTDGAA